MKKLIVDGLDLALPPFPYAHAVRCGPWVFCSGQLAVDLSHGLEVDAHVPPGAQTLTRPVKRQMKVLYRNLGAILTAAGSGLESVPKVVAFFTRREDVDPYNEELDLHQRLKPTSAAIPVSRLLAPEALIEIDPIGLVESGQDKMTPFDLPGMAVHRDAGYSKGIAFGDWVFTVGATAADHVARDDLGATALAPQARVDPNYWLGSPVKRQTRYVISDKLLPLLNAAGCGLEEVVRAQVYLTDLDRDYAAFTEVWNEFFPDHVPSTVVMPANGLGMTQCVVEISFVAVRPGTLPISAVTSARAPGALPGAAPHAIRAGDLVWCSTLAAIDGEGLIARAGDSKRLPHFAVPGQRQMAVLMEQLSEVLESSGSDVSRLAKLTVFTADLNQLPGYSEVWRSWLSDSPCAMTIVEVDGPFFAPGCTVAIDAIAVGG
jgi:2-iminobutanoate/2-iminopropanoate deaminase